MKFAVTKSQNVSQNCLVCGIDNSLGLKARFYETGENEVIAVFRPIAEHQSYPEIMHGGISAAILDETIGRAIMAHSDDKTFGVTVELTVRYKKPIPLDAEIKVIGRITKNRGRLFEGTGELYLPDGEIAVEAEGKYMKRRLEQITNLEFEANEWFSPEDTSPKEILI
jgi:acyl-coenzyme A thioesterase PaaI-like protein